MICKFFHRAAWKMSLENAQKRMDQLASEVSKSTESSIMDDYGKTFEYKRKEKGWEAFECPCGSPKQLSPSMKNKEFYCTQCGRKIKVLV